ncbi:MAG: 6-carboxytetrahydropterin synthase [Alistipes sp.]|nr:6-carboxytetrahydropterin synthase [Alistipes sp.]
MAIIRLTKEFSFEMAHTLTGYDGPCREIHGHSYRLFVTVIGEPILDPSNPKYGMVMDFGELKKIVNETIIHRCNHAFVLRRTTDNRALLETLQSAYSKIEAVAYQPTCENMVAEFARLIAARLPQRVKLHSIRLHETATSFAEWFAEDNP